MSKTVKIVVIVAAALGLLWFLSRRGSTTGITSIFGVQPRSLGIGGLFAGSPTTTAATIVATTPPKPSGVTNVWDFLSAATSAGSKVYGDYIDSEARG